MKTIRLILLIILSALAGSCTNDPGSLDEQIEYNTLSLRFPNRTLVETRSGTYPALDAEKNLSSVDIYVFTSESGAPGTFITLLPVTMDVLSADSETSIGGKCDLTSLADGDYFFVGVANYPGLSNLVTVDMSINDFCDMSVSQFPESGNDFVMSSAPVAFEYIRTILPSPLTIKLSRLAARIDIQNNATSAENPFVLTHARILNAVNESYLINRGATKVINVGGVEDKNLDWQANSAADQTKMFALMYAFENQSGNNDATQTYIEVKGTYNGEAAQFVIPFGTKTIVRNTRYLVTINKVEQTEIEYDVVVLDWEEGTVITFNPTEPTFKAPALIKLQHLNSAYNPVTSSIANYEGYAVEYDGGSTAVKDLTKIYIPFWRYRFNFHFTCPTDDMEVVIKDQDDISGFWIDAEKSIVDNAATFANDTYTKVFMLEFEANNLLHQQSREITIQFRNTKDPTNAYKEIVICQLGLPNNVQHISGANVGALNNFADSITVTNMETAFRGYTYQWGRNIPIDINTAYTLHTSKIDFSDDPSPLWNNNVFISITNMYTEQTAGFTWKGQVAKAEQKGATLSYIGNNGGDPCPVGWHLTTEGEYNTIAVGDKGFGSVDLSRFNNTSSDSRKYRRPLQYAYWKKSGSYTSPSGYTSSNSNGIIYAIQGINMYENAARTAVKVEMKQSGSLYYAEVTSRHLGEKSTIDKPKGNIDSDAFWQSNNENDYKAIFPIYGVGNNSGTGVYSYTTIGYYYSSDMQLISSPAGPVTLRIGSPNDTSGSSQRQSFSAHWSFSPDLACFLRCVKDYGDIPIPETMSNPTLE